MKFKDIYEGISNRFEKLEKKYPDSLPYIYAIIGSFLLALGSLLVKQCKEFPAYEMVYFRSIFILLLTTQLMEVTGESIYCNDKTTFKFLILRSLFSASSTLFFFTSNQMINLGDSTILFMTSPIWSNFISYFFFGEKFCIIRLFYTVISFIGIILLLKPPFLNSIKIENQEFDVNYFIGQVFSLIGAVSYAINSNLNKHLKDKISKQQLIFYLCFSALICSSILKAHQEYSSMNIYTFYSMGYVILFSLLQYFLQIFINQALFMKGANKILPFNYSQVLFALIFDYFLFDKTIDFLQTLSSLIIIFCCYKIATNK